MREREPGKDKDRCQSDSIDEFKHGYFLTCVEGWSPGLIVAVAPGQFLAPGIIVSVFGVVFFVAEVLFLVLVPHLHEKLVVLREVPRRKKRVFVK